jgi:hypothetical protein
MNPIDHPRLLKRIVFVVGALPLLLGVFPAGKFLQGIGVEGTAAAQESVRQERPLVVSFTGRDVEVADVFQSFARQVEAELDLDPAVQGQLSLNLRRARLKSAMDDLCTAFSCDWALNDEPAPLLVVRPKSSK